MPTLLEDINAASDWIVGALNYSGYKVSMDLESLREVDRFFNEHMNDRKHKPIPAKVSQVSMSNYAEKKKGTMK